MVTSLTSPTMPMTMTARESPRTTTPQSQSHQQQLPLSSSSSSRPVTPQPPPFPTATTNNSNSNNNSSNNVVIDEEKEKENEERAELIDEIQRLEKSMNGALRASRDEMESLKEASAEKRAAVKKMEEELKEIMSKMGNNTNNSGNGKNKKEEEMARRSSGGSTAGGNSNGRRTSRRTPVATSGGGVENTLRKSMIVQNSMLRRVSVSGDRPFFRRPPIKDVEEEIRNSFRRSSDPVQPPNPSSFFTRAQGMAGGGAGGGNGNGGCDESCTSKQSSNGSRGSKSRQQVGGLRGKQNLIRRASSKLLLNINDDSPSSSDDDSDSQDNNDNDKSKSLNEEEIDEEIVQLRETLASKDAQLTELKNQHQSNANTLSYLQSKLESVQTQGRTRWAQHTEVIEMSDIRKQALAKSVERRERLLKEMEGNLEGYEERIRSLEREIESKRSRARGLAASSSSPSNRDREMAKQTEEEMRKYQLRLKIYSQYTAKAIDSFLRCIDTAKRNDPEGMLFDPEEEDGEDVDPERQMLVDEVALDVDIHLNNLESMIREVGEKAEEYKVLSSMGLPSEDMAFDHCEGDAGYEMEDQDHYSKMQQHQQSNQLLSLSKECADLLADFISAISKTMESTTTRTGRPHSHSFSIEFQQPTTSSPNISEPKTIMDSDAMDNTAMIMNGISHGRNNTSLANMSPKHDNTPDINNSTNIEREELPYFQIRRKKRHLNELQRAQLAVDTNISILQNDIASFQTAMLHERRAHYEMTSDLQNKLQTLVERLEEDDSSSVMQGLVGELEETKEREESLLKEFNRHC